MAEASLEIDEAIICRWLARLFARELDRTAIETYQSGGAAPILDFLMANDQLEESVERLQSAIAGWPNLEDPKRDLAADFSTLFLGDPYSGAPPYASVYEAPHQFFGQPHDRMLKRLNAAGLEIDTTANEPADHIAIMLDYLALGLTRHKGERNFHAAFIEEELLNWLPTFQARAQKVPTASDSYQAVIALTNEFLGILCQQLRLKNLT